MPVVIEIIPIPIGSQFVQSIGSDDPDDLNDFPVMIVASGNATGLTEAGLSVPSGNSIVSLEGSGAVYKAVVRPQTSAGTIDFVISEDAVDEENSETTKTIRLSTSFPDTDAETPTELFTRSGIGIAVTPARILVNTSANGTLRRYTHDGTEQTGESLTSPSILGLDYINGDILVRRSGRFEIRRYDPAFNQIDAFNFSVDSIAHCRLGYVGRHSVSLSSRILTIAYGTTTVTEHDIDGLQDFQDIAHHDDLLYLSDNNSSNPITQFGLAEITDADEIRYLKNLNVDTDSNDIAIYQDTLYIVRSVVSTLDIRKYRPLAKNKKTRIDVQFIDEGDTLDLTQFAPDAERIIFDVGFDKPSYLSIDSSNQLVVALNAVTELTPVLVKLLGINRIDSQQFLFYLVIGQNEAPVWRDVASLTMKSNTTYDLHQIVDADSITFEPGQTQPTGGSIDDGIFTIGTVGGTTYFRATKNGLTADKEIRIDLIQDATLDNLSDVVRHKVEIAGIDISNDIVKRPPIRINKSFDNIELTRYRAHSVSLTLRNNEGKYNSDLTDNFWDANNLNAGGYQEKIDIYNEGFVDGTLVSTLLFTGIIDDQSESFSEVQATITAKDISVELEQSAIQDFGTLSKWATLLPQSDEETYEGVYVVENSLMPIQRLTGKAWNNRTQLTLSPLQLPSRGAVLENTAYLTSDNLHTSGGFLDDLPVLNFKTLPRSKNVQFLIDQLALSDTIYNTDIQLPKIVLDDPTIFNQGSVSFSVENTRITRLPADWVHDPTNKRILILLSNPEGHVFDLLVQCNIEDDRFRVLQTFDRDIKVHRIVRRNATNYYILTSEAITQDRSIATTPRISDKTGYSYDSRANGSVIKIYRYNTSSNVLEEHVTNTDTRPPQLGIHYWAGFENKFYIDEFEGIRPKNSGGFEWIGSYLYYRYAKDAEFGVARVNTSGATETLISETDLGFQNHLNFCFDVTGTSDVYAVYTTGTSAESTLTIKRRTGSGSVTTIFSDTKDLDELTELSDNGGTYLGCLECLFFNNILYLFCEIGRVDIDVDNGNTTLTRSRTKSAGLALYSCDVTNSNPSLTLIEKWEFAQSGGCNLCVHDGSVHFVEQSAYASQFTTLNPDLDTYNENMKYNMIPESLGSLRKINTSGSVESLGNLWYDDRPYNKAVTRVLSFNEELHTIMGYGNINEVLRYNSLASKADNNVHLVFGNKLNYIMPTFSADGNIYSELSTLARSVGSTLSFDGNVISVVNRQAFRAKTNGATGTGNTDISFDETNKTFPTSGYLRIGNELIAYTGISSGAFTGVTRGELGSEIADHADNISILYVDFLFQEADYLKISRQTDTTQHFNVIRDNQNLFDVSDDANIDKYSRQAYTLDLGLTQNEDAWIETIFTEYLTELKDLKKILNVTLPPRKKSRALELGKIIGLKYGQLIYTLRVESISDSTNVINIETRSVLSE